MKWTLVATVLSVGCIRDIEHLDPQQELDAWCPVIEVADALAFSTQQSAPAQALTLTANTVGYVEGAEVVLALSGDMESVRGVMFEIDPWSMPDLDARMEAGLSEAAQGLVEPGYSFPGCTRQGAYGPLTLDVSLGADAHTATGTFTWVDGVGALFEDAEVQIAFLISEPQGGVRTVTASRAVIGDLTWEHAGI